MQRNILASGVATAGVALGIGAAALALSTGTASADASESSSSSASSSTSSSASDSASDSTAGKTDSDSGTSSDTESKSDTDSGDPDRSTTSDADGDESPADDTPDAEDTTDDTPDEADIEKASDGTSETEDAPAAESDPVEQPETISEAVIQDAEPVVAEEDPAEAPLSTAIEDEGGKKPVGQWTPQPTGPKVPDVPPATPVEFLNWVGAQVQRTFFNRTPTTSAVQLVQTDSGEIVGQVRANDADGDELVYELVTGPTRGTVVLHADGTYTYTPNATMIGEGGADSFTVDVSDVGRHLHLFNGTGTTRTTVIVGVKSDLDVDQNLGSTRGFNVYNLSSADLVFQGYRSGSVDSGPAVGAVYAPGTNAHFEVVYHFFDDTEAVPYFYSAKQGQVTAYLLVEEVTGTSYAACRATYCTPNTEYYQDTSTVVFLDAPGTVIEIPAGQGQQQAQVLNQLCGDSSQASCKFEAGRQEQHYAPGKQVSPMLRNPTDERQSLAHQVSETEGYSDSLGGSVKFGGKLTEAINMEIMVTYNHTWTYSHTYSDTVTITVPPWTEASIWAENPFNRVYGDFQVDMGNTTWILRDVYFDTPNPGDKPVYSPHYEAIPHDSIDAGRPEDIAITL
jgi:hypothetical protein